MKKIILLLIVGFISVSLAQEFPVASDPGVFYQSNPSIFDRQEINSRASNLPIWTTLDRMELSERNNSIIDIEFESSSTLTETFKNITALWNKKNYEEALNLCKSIDETELNKVSIGIIWKDPIPTTAPANWGTDVRIGTRDSIETVSLAYEKSTGNLFAVLLYQENSTNYWSMNLSTDGGSTWNETYRWSSGPKIISASATVVGTHCYVGYAYDANPPNGRLRRFNTANGNVANFPDASAFTNVFTLGSTDSVVQVVVSSNQYDFNDRLYYAAITKSDSIKMYWNVPTDVIYRKYTSTFTDAEEGLDLCRNNGWNGSNYDYYQLGSYVTKTNGVKFFGVGSSDTLKQVGNFYTGLVRDYSSISAHNDTITAVFNYYGGSGSILQNRYLVSYNGGATWSYGLVGDTSLTSEAPDIAAGDGGVGIIYRYYTSPREGRFVWRPMRGAWSTPVTYTDNPPYYNKPAIEYLGNKKFGVVYLSWHSPERGAFFDLNNMLVDVTDQVVEIPANFDLSQNYPNPFNPSTLIRYQIPSQSHVSIMVYDALGTQIQELVNEDQSAGSYELEFNAEKLASGVYFYRIQAGSFIQTKKMILVR